MTQVIFSLSIRLFFNSLNQQHRKQFELGKGLLNGHSAYYVVAVRFFLLRTTKMTQFFVETRIPPKSSGRTSGLTVSNRSCCVCGFDVFGPRSK